jgi:hypothetical protein
MASSGQNEHEQRFNLETMNPDTEQIDINPLTDKTGNHTDIIFIDELTPISEIQGANKQFNVWPDGFIERINEGIRQCGIPLAWHFGKTGRFKVSESLKENDTYFLELQNNERLTFAWIEYVLPGKVKRSRRGPDSEDEMSSEELAAFLDMASQAFLKTYLSEDEQLS